MYCYDQGRKDDLRDFESKEIERYSQRIGDCGAKSKAKFLK